MEIPAETPSDEDGSQKASPAYLTAENVACLNKLFETKLAHNRKWRTINFVLSSICLSGGIVSLGAATLLAALQYGTPAAIFAASATVLVTLEHAFLFRDRWRFHVHVLGRLEITKARFDCGLTDRRQALEDLNHIVDEYALKAPFERAF